MKKEEVERRGKDGRLKTARVRSGVGRKAGNQNVRGGVRKKISQGITHKIFTVSNGGLSKVIRRSRGKK